MDERRGLEDLIDAMFVVYRDKPDDADFFLYKEGHVWYAGVGNPRNDEPLVGGFAEALYEGKGSTPCEAVGALIKNVDADVRNGDGWEWVDEEGEDE